MDRVIQKTAWQKNRRWIISGSAIALLAGVYVLVSFTSGRRLNVERERLTIETVKQDRFEEFIAVTGTVQPIRTITLVAVDGGIVQEKYLEEGAEVKKGDSILLLSNQDLQLDFMTRETALLDQLNNLRNTRISLEQSHLTMKQQLLDVENQLAKAKRDYEVNEKLNKSNLVAKKDYDDSYDQFHYLQNKYALLRQTVKQDSTLKAQQIVQMESSSSLIQSSLEQLKRNMDNLVLRAPADGQLASLTAEIGQNKTKGENIGLVDVKEGYKVRAGVDEHYISKVFPGLKASFDFDGKSYTMEVKKVYPQVTNGQFQVDMEFDKEVPSGVRQGQSLQVRLTLGAPAPAVLVGKGGFFQKTGGNWIFVVNGNKAEKRSIRVGRQNPDYYEVLEGLKPGEQVVTSGYETFGDADVLVLDQN